MRVLSVEEVSELELGTQRNWEHQLDESQVPLLHGLAKRGLMSVEEDDEHLYMETTPRGQLALRVHRAHLESVGAGR